MSLEAKNISNPTSLLHPALPELDSAAMDYWIELLERKTGVLLPPARKEFLSSGLQSRMRESGFDTLDSYQKQLLNGPKGNVEWSYLVDSLTVHESHFFRHRPSYELVRNDFIEHLNSPLYQGEYHVWSAGCASGEEVWSLLMLLDEYCKDYDQPCKISVTGTDISAKAIEQARSRQYPLQRVNEIPHRLLTYCKRSGNKAFEFIPELAKRAGFANLSLLDMNVGALKKLHVIYCQNVLIYFSRNRRLSILNQMVSFLRPGGMIVLGPSEVMHWNHPLMSRVPGRRVLAFRRSNNGGADL